MVADDQDDEQACEPNEIEFTTVETTIGEDFSSRALLLSPEEKQYVPMA